MSWSHMCQVICDECNDTDAHHRYTTEAELRDELERHLWAVTYQADRITRVVCPRCTEPEED